MGWLRYSDSFDSLEPFEPDEHTMADEPLLLYFTSGTTALPKLVEHTHVATRSGTCRPCTGSACSPATCTSTSPPPAGPSTPGATCSRPGSPGRRCCVYNYARFDAAELLDVVRDTQVTTFCAPPTVWRMLVQTDLAAWQTLAAGGAVGRRAAQPRGDRAGPAGLGTDHPRRLRPDRDDRCRSATRRASRVRPARWAGRCPATASCWWTRPPASDRRRGRALPRPGADGPWR